jgi:hypothetical protein
MFRPMTIAFERVAPVLPVRDVEVALARYQALGFSAEAYRVSGVPEPIYGFLRWGDVHIHLARAADLDPATNTSVCYLYVADADALYELWLTAGVPGALHPPRDTPYRLREFGYVDPDGNLLRVGSQLTPTPR